MATPTDSEKMARECEAFEQWARGIHMNVRKNKDGMYRYADTLIAWTAWARRSLAAHESRAQPPRKPDECANSCPPFQVCDYCHGPKGEDERAQPASVAADWSVIPFTGSVKRSDERWEIYDSSGSGGVVCASSIGDALVRDMLDALAAAPQPAKENGK